VTVVVVITGPAKLVLDALGRSAADRPTVGSARSASRIPSPRWSSCSISAAWPATYSVRMRGTPHRANSPRSRKAWVPMILPS